MVFAGSPCAGALEMQMSTLGVEFAVFMTFGG